MSLFIAHRGLCAYAPENTAAAFDLAWAHDCDGIELDIHTSADEALWVVHDDNLRRTTGYDADVATQTSETLAQLDAGSWFSPDFHGEPLPQLEPVILSAPAGKLIQIEIKALPGDSGASWQTFWHYLEHVRRDLRLQIISFAPEMVAQARARYPELEALLVSEDPQAIALAKDCGATGVDIWERHASRAFIDHAHAQGLSVGCWTVNDYARARELEAWGADFVTGERWLAGWKESPLG